MDGNKEKLIRLLLPSLSILLSLAITIGGAFLSGKLQAALMEERIATLQRDMARHEMEKSEQIRRTAERADDHEKRIIRLETTYSAIQVTLDEMRGDIKMLLKGPR